MKNVIFCAVCLILEQCGESKKTNRAKLIIDKIRELEIRFLNELKRIFFAIMTLHFICLTILSNPFKFKSQNCYLVIIFFYS